jgi:hypothetical protein
VIAEKSEQPVAQVFHGHRKNGFGLNVMSVVFQDFGFLNYIIDLKLYNPEVAISIPMLTGEK